MKDIFYQLWGKKMDVRVYEKTIVEKFVTIDGIEFKLGELLSVLYQIIGTIDCDGSLCMEYPLRSYELYDFKITKELVKMGLVYNYTGSKMADLYLAKDINSIKELINILEEQYC